MTLSNPGPGTLALQETLPDIIQRELFGPYGQDFLIVWPSSSGAVYGTTRTPGTQVQVRGSIQEAPLREQAQAGGAGLSIPGFVLYALCRDVDLGIPGWHVLFDGMRYYPVKDSVNLAQQGVCWEVYLQSPEQVTADGTP